MTRFSGRTLPADSRIAVIANDAIGNFVVVTPLLKMLRDAFGPSELHYYGGRRTWELQVGHPLIDYTYALWGTPPWEAASEIVRVRTERPYDLVVNVESSPASKFFASLATGPSGSVCGPCIGQDGRGDLPFEDDERGWLWEDPNWPAEDLASRYGFLESGFIGEIFCRLCYMEGPVPAYRIQAVDPPCRVPDVLMAPSASLPQKLWSSSGWLAAVDWAGRKGLSVGLLGAKPAAQKRFWLGCSTEDELVEAGGIEDMRGTMSLPEVAGALAKARLVLTIDNGILHLAASAGAATVGLYRHGFHRLWAPPAPALRVVAAAEARPVCEIPVSQVLEALESAM